MKMQKNETSVNRLHYQQLRLYICFLSNGHIKIENYTEVRSNIDKRVISKCYFHASCPDQNSLFVFFFLSIRSLIMLLPNLYNVRSIINFKQRTVQT